ncbi:hypothetical protein TNCT_462901 [Trichonephila clavata]|uniref:Uncharacterized protein n=1 Tax=Trichonephila clavata TaxID=2740835 RepID=A0A8X6LTP3_TRICU|nr:hypothetical protein TNCT_462901 [Trichonephila clavata]
MDLIKNCDRYKNYLDSVDELSNLIIDERKSEESQQLKLEKKSEEKLRCCLKKRHFTLCFSQNQNTETASERVIQPSSVGYRNRAKERENTRMVNYPRGQSSSYPKTALWRERLRERVFSGCKRSVYWRFVWGNARRQSFIRCWFNKRFYFAQVYE